MDLRIERTYRSLREAFTSLMEEKGYDKITVAELCDRAMIRRTTFYKHFADKGEFFAFFIASMHDDFYTRISDSSESESLADYSSRMFRELIAFSLEHECFIDGVVSSPSAPILLEELGALIARQVSLKQAEALRCDRDVGIGYASLVYGHGMVSMLKRWWLNGRDRDELETMEATLAHTIDIPASVV